MLWARLELTSAQMAKLIGISRRQVEWWRRRGYLPPSPDKPDRFGGDAVTVAELMKQAIDAGVPPARGHELAVRHLARTLRQGVEDARQRGLEPASSPSALGDLEQKLLTARSTISLVLDVIRPLARPRHGEEADAGTG